MSSLKWTTAPADRDPGVYKDGMRFLVNGEVHPWSGPSHMITSPVHEPKGGTFIRRVLGPAALVDAETARTALQAAVKAYDKGRGLWPTSPVSKRIACMATFLEKMAERRLEVARILTWEVAKPWKDSVAEFDRTVEYGWQTIEALKVLDRQSSGFVRDGGFLAQIRRSPYGVALCMGPYNYPLNETFATLLPAIIMGNTVVVKLPRLGMLCNMPLLDAFAEAFPPGVINIIGGEGSVVVNPIIDGGQVDLLAFIGSAGVANQIRSKHPHPNRLRSVLGLGAKNPAIILPDADLEVAVKECVAGSLTFNGQRCTALKIIFVHRAIAETFVKQFTEKVSSLPAGMPFEDSVVLTPLSEDRAVAKMDAYVQDAVKKGARVMNVGGGTIDKTFFHPAVLYPVKAGMDVWSQEQFGPVVPIAVFDDPNEVLDYMAASPYGQQASVFGKDPAKVGPLLDALVNQVCRVNVNTQCRRGPDTFPFGGRKDSAEGTLSIADALRVFSIRTLVSGQDNPATHELNQQILRGRHSSFLSTDYLF